MSERAMTTDTAVRKADLSGVIAFLLLRHGSVLSASADNPHRPVYEAARDSAEREILWRFEQLQLGASATPTTAKVPKPRLMGDVGPVDYVDGVRFEQSSGCVFYDLGIAHPPQVPGPCAICDGRPALAMLAEEPNG